ncbi:MAG: hypothetical protein NDF55_04635 [archaeon GB-1867-005]|nr:hypothetical protein [Candidatus Culexmicrobium cathedralense]
MPESLEHERCKMLLARLTRCKTEKYIETRRRPDVVCSNNLFFEFICAKKPSGKRVCYIEPRLRIGRKEFALGKISCDKLESAS